MRHKDIGPILEGWDYVPNEIRVRMIIGQDGRKKLQMRVDLGLMQMEVEGRPDGQRPHGYESLLEYYEAKLEHHRSRFGDEANFQLSHEDCLRLQQESLQYYYRYLSFFHLGEYDGAARDTARNLRLFDFIKNNAAAQEDQWALEQYRPYVLRMNVLARAEAAVQRKEYRRALELIEEGIEQIEDLFREYGRPDLIADNRELLVLRERAEQLRTAPPVSPAEKLQKALDEAVAAEDYERAAALRDALKQLRGEW